MSIVNSGGQGYGGLDFSQSGGFVPPDTCGAAGPINYVETVNQTLAIYSPKATGAAKVSDSLGHFLFTVGGLTRADSGSGQSDPIVIYDELAGRFIVGDMDVNFNTHVSAFDLAVSKTNSPATLTSADWNFYKITTTESGADADYPGNFGYNHDGFVFTLNMLVGTGGHVQVVSIDSSDLQSGVTQANLHVYKNDLNDFSVRPTTMHDSVAGDPMWLVTEHGDNHSIDVIKMTSPSGTILSSSATFTYTNLAVTSYSGVVPPRNPNGKVITNNISSQILKAAEENHILVATHAVSVSTTQDVAQWYAIDVSRTPTVSQQGRINAGLHTYVYYPAIDINSSGQIGMTYMRSGTDSTTDYMSMWITGRTSGDAAGTMETPVIVPAGTGKGNYKDFTTGGRAGDLSGINIDPVDGSFWAANEFANTEAGANWGTAIANFTIGSVIDADLTLTNNNTLTVNENSSGNIITSAKLLVSDGSDPASGLVYTLTASPAHGTLRNNGTALSVAGTFTQADINNNKITYDNAGGSATDSFTFTLADSTDGGILGPTTFNISVTDNDLSLTDTGLAVNESSIGTIIGSTKLSINDDSDAAASLSYTLTSVPSHGTLKNNGTTLSVGSTFTQADVNNNKLTYDNAGGAASDAFQFTVSDSTDGGSLATQTFTISVTDSDLSLTNAGLTVNESSTANTIASAKLLVSDDSDPAGSLVYTVTAIPAHGTLKNNGTALSVGGTFTQTDINNNKITYDNAGGSATDSFTFTLADSTDGGSLGPTTFNISVIGTAVIVANGQPGYSETGTWATESVATDYGGTDRYATSSGNGTNTATWQVSGLPTGLYAVQVSWSPWPSQASNAPFAIYDGSTSSTPLQTVLVNQKPSPMGSVYGGATFQQIAAVNISSGTLKVVLSNTGTDGAWIIANAVRIAPVPASNTDLTWSASGDGITGPATASTQGTFTINRIYTVSGTAAPSSFAIAYYASTSSSTSQDLSKAILLGTEIISAASDLGLGNHAGTSPAFQINTAGSYYLFAKLNVNNDFLESDGGNDTNNLAVTATAMAVSGPVIVANGQPGYSETGTWATESVATDYGGTDRYATSSGNGNNTATWQVSGLPAGTYAVQVTWPPWPSQASNAPFAIYDGSTSSTPLQTVLVNEMPSPVGSVYGGATFQQIATVNISSGTLKVVLSNTGTDGAWIIANAVRIAPVP